MFPTVCIRAPLARKREYIPRGCILIAAASPCWTEPFGAANYSLWEKSFMMSREKCLATARLCLIGLLVGSLFAQQAAPQSNPSSENTKMNQRDRKPSERPADQGKNASSDREMM